MDTKKEYDQIIVVIGIYGVTSAYKAKLEGNHSHHLGDNIYCEIVEGIKVHKYGALILYTNNKKVWDFENCIIEFNYYTNSPIANYKGRQYNQPFNMNIFYQIWGKQTPKEKHQNYDIAPIIEKVFEY